MYHTSNYACEGVYAPLEIWTPFSNSESNKTKKRLCRLRKRLSESAPISPRDILTFVEVSGEEDAVYQDSEESKGAENKENILHVTSDLTSGLTSSLTSDLTSVLTSVGARQDASMSPRKTKRAWRAVLDNTAPEAQVKVSFLEEHFGVFAPFIAAVGMVVGFILF